MKPTHQSVEGRHDVTAWQFHDQNPIPAWVAKIFHEVGSDHWQGIARDGSLVKAKEWDWAVAFEGTTAIVLTNDEFKKLFRRIP